MHKIAKILSAISLSLIYSIGAVSALGGVRDSKTVEAADEESTRTIYCLSPSPDTLYVHSWNSSGDVTTWPGLQMTKVDNVSIGGYSLYKYTAISSSFSEWSGFLFFDGDTTNQGYKSKDGTFPASDLTKNLFQYYGASSDISSFTLTGEFAQKYKLVGHSTNWKASDENAKEFVVNPANSSEYMLTGVDLTKSSTNGSGYKVVLVDEEDAEILWIGDSSEANIVVEDGRYDVYFKPAGDDDWANKWSNFILNNEYSLTLKHTDESVADTTYDLVKNSSAADGIVEYMTGEYNSEVGKNVAVKVDVKKGDTLELKKNDVVVSSFVPTSSGKNNYSSSGFLFDASGVIYVDETNSKIFAGGLDSDFGMLVNDEFVALTKNAENTTAKEYYVLNYSFVENDVIKFVNTTTEYTPTIFVNSILDEHGYNTCFEVLSDNGGIKVEEDVTVSLYLKLGTPNNTVYFTSSAYDQAIDYANAFETKFGFSSTTDTGVCKHDGTTTSEAISSAWTEMKTKYTTDVTDETAQKILKGEISSSHDSIVKFHNAYDYIYSKYGTSLSLDNFLNRSVTTSSARSLNLTSDNSVTFIAIIVVASITLIAASSYIVVKKSKRQ